MGRWLRGLACVALALVFASPAFAEEAASVALEGTWHVLVHYQDEAAGNPEAERWEDRVWVLRRDGNRLVWHDYPIVVFDNRSGRFGSVGGNPRARVLHYWEPNGVQQAELMGGPKVNSRGSKEKRLRPSGDGWKSYQASAAASAMTITFVANWFIENASGLPRFRMEDVLGSAMTESLEGGTVYETESVEEGGNVLRGRYARDGTRKGTFRMLRTPGVRGLGTEEEQRERIRNRQRAQSGLEALQGRVRPSDMAEEDREALRSTLAIELRRSLAAQGQPPSDADVESLVDQAEQLLEEGRTLPEIERLLQEGELVP